MFAAHSQVTLDLSWLSQSSRMGSAVVVPDLLLSVWSAAYLLSLSRITSRLKSWLNWKQQRDGLTCLQRLRTWRRSISLP